MKKINEGTKITLTFSQLKRLMKECCSINETFESELQAADIIAGSIFKYNNPRSIYMVDVHGSNISPFVQLVHRVISDKEDPNRYAKMKSIGAGSVIWGYEVKPFNNSDGSWDNLLHENPIDYMSLVCKTIYGIFFKYPEKYSMSKSPDPGAMMLGFPGAGSSFATKDAGSTVLIANIGESSVQKDILVAIYNPKNRAKDYFFIEVKSSAAGKRLSNAEIFKLGGTFLSRPLATLPSLQ